jgi:hypothetical protein
VAQKKKSAADYYRENKKAGQGKAKHEGNGQARPGLVSASMASVRPKPVRWLVPGRVPLGKVVLAAGDGGHGKSTLALHLAACLSRATAAFGLNYADALDGETLLIQCEDDWEDTVLPRLLALGADVARVHRLVGVRGADGQLSAFTLAHFQELEEKLEDCPGIKLVVIDPAGAYVGSGVDDHRDNELRALLGPLAELAARRRVTILLIKHFNKAPTLKAVQKIGGGVGYVNAVRAAFVVLPDQEDEDRALVLPAKFNVGRRPKGLAFRRVGLSPEQLDEVLRPYEELSAEDRGRIGETVFRLEWEGEVDVTADQQLAEGQRAERGPSKAEQCMAWLREFLREYAYPDGELQDAAEKAGHSLAQLKAAKARLRQEGLRSKPLGFSGAWWNGFGDPRDWRQRPEPARGTVHTGESGQTAGAPQETARQTGGAAQSRQCGQSGQCDGGQAPEGADLYGRSREAFPDEGAER